MSLYSEIASVRAEAARLDFTRSMLTLLGLAPVVVFFVARFVWMLPAFLWASGMWGWRKADTIIKARESAARGG